MEVNMRCREIRSGLGVVSVIKVHIVNEIRAGIQTTPFFLYLEEIIRYNLGREVGKLTWII